MAICFVSTRRQLAKKRKAPKHLMKPLRLSAELAAFIGKKELPRPHIVKAVWVYAKKNGLQNGAEIRNSMGLKPLFGNKPRIRFGEIAAMIKKHTG